MSPSLALWGRMPFTRLSSQDQDQDHSSQDQDRILYWSETGLATRPKSQTTSLVWSVCLSVRMFVCLSVCPSVFTWYSFYHFTDGRRLSRPRTVMVGWSIYETFRSLLHLMLLLKCAALSGCSDRCVVVHDVHNVLLKIPFYLGSICVLNSRTRLRQCSLSFHICDVFRCSA